MVENINKLLATLNMVEVHGTDNLGRLLGCIQMLQSMKLELETNATKASEDIE